MKNFIRNLINRFTLQTPDILDNLKPRVDIENISKNIEIPFDKKFDKKILDKLRLNQKSFGKLNGNKIFYVIKRTPGTGMFSNITFVLNHLKICEKYNFIPIIDMENFITIYNEKKKIRNNYNAWNYYFDNLNSYSLNEVYKSKYVIIANDKFFNFFSYSIDKDKELIRLLNSEVKLNRYLQGIYKKSLIKFKHKKVLGIHFRGTSYKRSAGHPLPATKKQMEELTKKILKEDNIDMIFLVTEELNYLDFFKKKFKDKLFYIKSAYRSNKNDAFTIYPRNLHRYKLGREAVLESILLSHCDYFIYLCSNISAAAISFNKNSSQKRYEIDNGSNSKNVIISQFYWYLKRMIPKKLGGI